MLTLRIALISCSLTLAACNLNLHDCSRGMFFGGGAGTSNCPPDPFYEPRLLPAQELRPYLDAIDDHVSRSRR